jgi:hypothetical protein
MQSAETVDAFRQQARWATELGSPLYAELLTRAAADLERGGVLASVLADWHGRPLADALPLRLFGAIHRLVLDGAVPELARFYPSMGGTPRWPDCWEVFRTLMVERCEELRAALERQVQTNEVRRCSALLGGFLTVAHATGLPLHLLEIGCSAGLNLLWDRYRYELFASAADAPPANGAALAYRWGDAQASVVIRSSWHGHGAVPACAASVVSRAGCDVAPVDVRDPNQVRTLESFVWPDQLERLALLRAAVALASAQPPPIEAQAADEWLPARLVERPTGAATVVFHSIMWNYLSRDAQRRIGTLLADIGAQAHAGAPLAWLRLEFVSHTGAQLRLTLWPGGSERTLAVADPHGRWTRWLGPAID